MLNVDSLTSSANGSLAAGGHLNKKQFIQVQSRFVLLGGVARPLSFDVSQDFNVFFFKVILCSLAHLQECFPDVA